jgi:hypothetical protein
MLQVQKNYSEETAQKRYDELKKEFGKNKKLPQHYGLQALLALSHYPELKDIKIEFVFGESSHPLSTQPTRGSVFLPARDRTYRILISTKLPRSRQDVMFKNLEFNLQVMQFGHELGHVMDYLSKTTMGILYDALFYKFPFHKKTVERNADRICLNNGFGYQMLEFCKLVKKLVKIYPEEKYYNTYFKYYFSLSDIETGLKNLRIYEGS